MYAQIKFPQKWIRLVVLTAFNGSLVLSSAPAFAEPIPLTQATLRKVVNRVELLLRSQPVRDAQVNDRLTNSGDAIKTQRASRTELKFNDGTLAKVGELATFRFTPNTRRFDLGNGTYLFLVPPGRGPTEFITKNAKAGVKGSALFIRYIEETDTTIMGALTNNPLGPMDITVGGKKQDLYAGQMVVAIKDRIDRVETFDLTTFFRTSPMYRDIDLKDPDLQAVRQEMTDAVTTQVAAIGALPTQVAITPKPSISTDPTSSLPRRELTEARENLNNQGRTQPIAQPTPPIVIDPPIVRPTPPNIIDSPIVRPTPPTIIDSPIVQPTPPIVIDPPIVKPTPPNIIDSPIVKPTPPNIKDPIVQPMPPSIIGSPIIKPTPPNIIDSPIVRPTPPNIIDSPIVRPTPPNIKDPTQHQYTYVTVYLGGKPVVYLKVDGRIDYSRVIEFVKPAIAPQPTPQPVPIEAKPQPIPVAPTIIVTPIEPSRPRIEITPTLEIKPEIKVQLEVVKPTIEPIRLPVDSIKTNIEVIKPLIEPIRPLVNLIKTNIEAIKSTIEPIRPPVEIGKPPIDPVKLPVEIGKPPIEVTAPVIQPDVIKVMPAALTDPKITPPPVTPPITTPPITTPPVTPPVTTPPVTPPVTAPPVTSPITTPPVTTPPVTPPVTTPPITTPPATAPVTPPPATPPTTISP